MTILSANLNMRDHQTQPPIDKITSQFQDKPFQRFFISFLLL